MGIILYFDCCHPWLLMFQGRKYFLIFRLYIFCCRISRIMSLGPAVIQYGDHIVLQRYHTIHCVWGYYIVYLQHSREEHICCQLMVLAFPEELSLGSMIPFFIMPMMLEIFEKIIAVSFVSLYKSVFSKSLDWWISSILEAGSGCCNFPSTYCILIGED